MTPQERDLIEGLFQRLKAAEIPDKDREAEQLIQAQVAGQPSAPYQLVQTVLVQDHALAAAQARIEQLEKQAANRAPEPTGGTSFLGGLLGRNRWNQATPEPAPAAAPRSSVPITAPAPAAAPAQAFGGGSFLSTALTTAAGVAGGALLYDGLRSLLFHNPGPFGPYVGSNWGAGGPGGNIYETNVVNYYGDERRGNDRGTVDTSAPSPDLSDGLQDASYDQPDDSDPGNFDSGQDV